MHHRRDIDGLRAVAVLAVLFYHFDFEGFSGGFSGVDIFFVISGYVIAKSIIYDTLNEQFSIANFYFKRIRRILPAYVAIIFVTSVFAYIFLMRRDFADYARSLAASSAFVSNIYFWRTSGYFAASAHTKPLLHTWSLSVEEQFYIFAPLLVHFLYRFERAKRALLLLPLMLSSFGLSVAAVFVAQTAGFFLLPTRAWELLLGVFLALMNWPAPASPKIREAMSALGAALILVGIFTLSEENPFPGWSALWPCLGAALIIQAGSEPASLKAPLVSRVLSTGPFVFVGLISYSLYLVHWPIAALARYELLKAPDVLDSCLMLAASLGLSVLSWRYVEQPFRSIAPRHTGSVLTAGASVAVVGALLGWSASALSNMGAGAPDLAQRDGGGGDEIWGGNHCFNLKQNQPIDWDPKACTRIRGGHGRILVWGDSFAAQYMPGIIQEAKRIDADVLQYTSAGCPPILDYFSFANVGCSQSNSRIPTLIHEENIDTIILAARWTNVHMEHLNALPKTIAQLKGLGLRVFVFGQSPEFVMDVRSIDYISGARMKPGKYSWTVSFRQEVNENVRKLSSDANFVDPMNYLCSETTCLYRDDAEYYYNDYGHFSVVGSARAVRAYFPTGAVDAGPAGGPNSSDITAK